LGRVLIRWVALVAAVLATAAAADERDRSASAHTRDRSVANSRTAEEPARREPPSATICDAACLQRYVDLYLTAVVAHDPKLVPLADHVRFTEMGQELVPGDGFWHTASDIGRYKHYFPDVTAGQIGYIGTMRENGELVLLGLRLRVEAGRISEIETVLRRKGLEPAATDVGIEELDGRAAVDPLWLEPVPAPERASREKLVAAASLYFAGIGHDPGNDSPPFADDCLRVENGLQTSGSPKPERASGASRLAALDCKRQFETGYFAVVTRVDHRRFVAVDSEHGLVFALATLDYAGTRSVTLRDGRVVPTPAFAAPSSSLLVQAFRIEKGLIRRLEAVATRVPYRMGPGWEASAAGRQ
jgi:hypothetical protein